MQLTFAMRQHHQWSLFGLEALTPWERDFHVTLLQQYLKEQQDKLRAMENNNG